MNTTDKLELYENTRSTLSDLSYSMYREHWSDIQTVEEDGKYSQAIDNGIAIIKNVNALINSIQSEIQSLETSIVSDITNKASKELTLSIYRDILNKL